ncbi:RimK family protein [Novipirellula sp. SH528]|uniref:RimK family protein n=1 Tax=Novipirellula sp. SH528 TaxID=3454466 RepID=UPI003F9EEC68
MSDVIVTESQAGWIEAIDGVEVVDPREYLTDPRWNRRRGIKVYNLARSYRYQSFGYYVSLLAEARGHRPMPDVTAIQDLAGKANVRLLPPELDELIQHALSPLTKDTFELSVYFGRNLAKRYDRLSRELFNTFPCPLLRFEFSRRKDKWRLRRAEVIGIKAVPQAHWPFVAQQAELHFAGRGAARSKKNSLRYDLAILHDPNEKDLAPSDPKALQKMIKAAASVGIRAELLTREDAGRLLEFDALFIRETTSVNHHTYRLARWAEREGLVVMDDPQSIIRCTNKVYLAEILDRAKIDVPKTIVVHRGNADQIVPTIGLPCVLKRPDSAFSKGVTKAESETELAEKLEEMFEYSELVIAQQFMRTDFDWRIGVLDGRAFFASKYHMARGHWQIAKYEDEGKQTFGKAETIPIELAPRRAVSIAVKAANIIGDGLYGVDVKESDGKFYIIEVNDNPNLDSGVEDAIMREDLYRRIMESFLRRIERRKSGDSTQ